MSKILAIDFGKKRTGLAETDELQMMAFGLTAVDTKDLIPFIEKYLEQNEIQTVVIGESLDLQGNKNEIEDDIEKLIEQLNKKFPQLSIAREDERYTSKLAKRSLLEMGKKKKARRDKYLIDEVSATFILRSYLENNSAL